MKIYDLRFTIYDLRFTIENKNDPRMRDCPRVVYYLLVVDKLSCPSEIGGGADAGDILQVEGRDLVDVVIQPVCKQ